MTLCQHIEKLRTQSKRLLGGALLLSLLSFGGGSLYQPQLRQATATEQVVISNPATRPAHSCKWSASSFQDERISTSLSPRQITAANLVYGRLSEVRIKANSIKARSFIGPIEHCRPTHIPHSSDEDNFYSFRG